MSTIKKLHVKTKNKKIEWATKASFNSEIAQSLLPGNEIDEPILQAIIEYDFNDESKLLNQKFIALLLFFGANINLLDGKGHTILHLTISNGGSNNIDLIALLLANQASINDVTLYDHETPLNLAVLFNKEINNKTHLITILLDHGADPNIQNINGNTALIFAIMLHDKKNDQTEVIKILLNRGSNPNLQNKMGNTALIYALKQYRGISQTMPLANNSYDDFNNSKIITELLAYGANVDLKNNEYEAARDIAYQQKIENFEELVKTHSSFRN